MATDIVERLNGLADQDYESNPFTALAREAAAEIARLRGEVSKWQGLAEAGVTLAEVQRRYDARNAAPAMPNGVEGLRIGDCRLINGEWWTCNDPRDGKFVRFQGSHEPTRAADNRDAAGVEISERLAQAEYDAEILSSMERLLRDNEFGFTGRWDEIVAQLLGRLRDTPTAVPAGEAVADALIEAIAASSHPAGEYQRSDIVVSMHAVEAALRYAEWDNLPPSPKESPQPADGGAVAWMRRSVTYKAVDGRTDGERVISERKVFEDDVPLYTAPAPAVSGEDGAVVVCIWRKQDEYGDHVSTSCGHEFVLNDAGGYEDGTPALPFCCYCAKPTVFRQWRDESECTCDNGEGPECWACSDRRATAALQHRGDSRGGEADRG